MIKNFVNTFLLSNLNIPRNDDSYRVIFITNLSFIISILISFIFIFINMYQEAFKIIVIDVIVIFSSYLGLYLLRKNYDINKMATFSVLMIFSALLSILFVRVGADYTLMWSLVFALIAMTLKGAKKGLYYSIVFYLFHFIFLYAYIGETITFEGYIRFIAVSIIMTLMAYFYEITTQDTFKMLRNSTLKVKDLNKNLEQKVKVEVEINRKKEQQLIQQTRLAQMGEMISMIAHQWRQPLGAISTTAANLEMKIDLETFDLNTKKGQDEHSSYFKKRLNKIEDFVETLTETIDDFRNFYKPNKERVETTLEQVVTKSINILKGSLENEHIEVIYNYNSNIKIQMYDSEMMQVILNILKNSQDNFRDKALKNPQVIISTKDKTLSICDNGGGISEDIMEKIFDPYFSTKDEKNGTGLGLYMSKTIVEEHHKGTLHVENRDDGVCFIIELKE